jgi:hypothetical protein
MATCMDQAAIITVDMPMHRTRARCAFFAPQLSAF